MRARSTAGNAGDQVAIGFREVERGVQSFLNKAQSKVKQNQC